MQLPRIHKMFGQKAHRNRQKEIVTYSENNIGKTAVRTAQEKQMELGWSVLPDQPYSPKPA